MAAPSGIIFYGDPHGRWQPLFDEYARRPARAVVLLGDCELERPLDETLEPIISDGTPVHWIYGNHDTDHARWWDNLTRAGGGLHGMVTNVGGLYLAGLGGTYAGRVWYPRLGDEEAVFRTRGEWLKAIPRNERCGKLLPLRRRHIVLPEDHTALSGCRADILLCHEAPSSHRHGFGAVDDLAKGLGVRLVVHGHHHTSYVGASRDGVRVMGLGIAECWRLDDPQSAP